MQHKWPKTPPPLSPEKQEISDDFMKHWLEVLSKKYSIIDTFNHNYVVKNAPQEFLTTLEIGIGNGEHLEYENLSKEQKENYVGIDIRENLIDIVKKKYLDIQAILADCQEKTPFEDNHFDRIIAIHVLEHLPNLPLAIKEMHRVCNKDSGLLSIVIPCEGSLAYTFARKISAQKIFEKRYNQPYRWFIEREHINLPHEIFEELSLHFTKISSSYFPIPLIRAEFCNLCIGATFKPK